jgi:hypothetical protein
MHTLHLLPRDLWRVTAIAALLTLAVMVPLLLFPPLVSDDTSRAGSAAQSSSAVPSTAQPTPDAKPAWVIDPLAPPSFSTSTAR